MHATDAEISRSIGYVGFGQWAVSIPQSSFHQEFPNPLTGSTGDGRPVGNGPRPRCGPGPGGSDRGRLSAEVRPRLPGAASRSPVGRRDMDADTRSRPGAALASSPPGHTTSARARVPALDGPAQSNDSARDRAAPRVLSMAALLLVSVALVDLGGVLEAPWKPRTCRVHLHSHRSGPEPDPAVPAHRRGVAEARPGRRAVEPAGGHARGSGAGRQSQPDQPRPRCRRRSRSLSAGMIPRESSTWVRADRGRSAQAPHTQTPWPPGKYRAGALRRLIIPTALMGTPSGLHDPRKSAGL